MLTDAAIRPVTEIRMLNTLIEKEGGSHDLVEHLLAQTNT